MKGIDMKRFLSVVASLVLVSSWVLAENVTLTFQEGDGSAYSDTIDCHGVQEYPTYNHEGCPWLTVGGPTGWHRVCFIQFPNAIGSAQGQVPPNVTIVSATLTVTDTDGTGSSVSVYRVTEETAYQLVGGPGDNGYNKSPSYGYRNGASVAWSVNGCAGSPSREATALDTVVMSQGYHGYAFNITSAVQHWANAPAENWGIVFDTGSTQQGLYSSNITDFPSYRPLLTVTYLPAGPDTTPPGPVTSLIAYADDLQIDLSWTNPTDTDFDGVVILRKEGNVPTGVPSQGTSYSVGETVGDANVVFVGNSTTFIDSNVTNRTTYYYSAFAFDSARNYSSEVGVNSTARDLITLTFQKGDGGANSDVEDGYMLSEFPTYSHAASAYLSAGKDANGNYASTVIRFPKIVGSEDGQVPDGVLILSAKLTLTSTDAHNVAVSAFKVNDPWCQTGSRFGPGGQADGESPSWYERLKGTPWTASGCGEASRATTALEVATVTQGYAPVVWDVTSAVQQWADDRTQNCGICLDARDATAIQGFYSSDEQGFPQYRPILEVTYVSSADTTPPSVAITTSTSSEVSPAFIEGTCSSDAATVQLVVDGGMPTDVTRTSATTWYANAPLAMTGSTQINVTASDASQNFASVEKDVTWIVTDIPNSSDALVRKGDSLLLTATGTGSILEIDPGTGNWVTVGLPGATYPAAFDTAGVYSVRARIDSGVESSVTVTVVDVDLTGYVVDQKGFKRELTVSVYPESAANRIAYLSEDVTSMGVSVKEVTASGAVIYLQPFTRDSWFDARLGGANGPVIARQLVNVFEYESTARHSIQVEPEDDEGNMVGTATVTMRPYLHNVTFEFIINSPGVTFDGGVTQFMVLSEADFVQQPDGSATYDYRIHYASGVSQLCHDIHTYQHYSPPPGVPVGKEDNDNPVVWSVNVTASPVPACVNRDVTCAAIPTGCSVVGLPKWQIDGQTKFGETVVFTFSTTGEKTGTFKGTYKVDQTGEIVDVSKSVTVRILKLIELIRKEPPPPDCSADGHYGFCIRPSNVQTVDIEFDATVEPNVPWAIAALRWSVIGGGATVSPPNGTDKYTTAFNTDGEKTVRVKCLCGCTMKEVKFNVIDQFTILPGDCSVCIGGQQVFQAKTCVEDEGGGCHCEVIDANWALTFGPPANGSITPGEHSIIYSSIAVSGSPGDITLDGWHPDHQQDEEHWSDDVKITNTKVDEIQQSGFCPSHGLAAKDVATAFDATIAPDGAAWPSGHPVWTVEGGTAVPPNGSDSISAYFHVASETMNDFKKVTASCGSDQSKFELGVLVCALAIEPCEDNHLVVQGTKEHRWRAVFKPGWDIVGGKVTWSVGGDAEIIKVGTEPGETGHDEIIVLKGGNIGGIGVVQAKVSAFYSNLSVNCECTLEIPVVDLESITGTEVGNSGNSVTVSGNSGASGQIVVPVKMSGEATYLDAEMNLTGVVTPSGGELGKACLFKVENANPGSGNFQVGSQNIGLGNTEGLFTLYAGPDRDEDGVLSDTEVKYTLEIIVVQLSIPDLGWPGPTEDTTDDYCITDPGSCRSNLKGEVTITCPAGRNIPSVQSGLFVEPDNATIAPTQVSLGGGVSSVPFTLTGTSASSAVGETLVQAKGGSNVYAQKSFTVYDVGALIAEEVGTPQNSVQATKTAPSQELMILEDANGQAKFSFALSWSPTGLISDGLFKWRVVDSGDVLVQSGDFGFSGETYEITWSKWIDTDREFTIEAGVDADTDGVLDGDEVLRSVVVTIARMDLVRETYPGSNLFDALQRSVISAPHPEIRMSNLSASDMSIYDGIVTVNVSGEVFDGVADVVEGRTADIKYVVVNGTEISVVRDTAYEEAYRNLSRPYAFRGTFQGQIEFRAMPGQNLIYAATSPNALGNKGFDTATFEVSTNAATIMSQGALSVRNLAVSLTTAPTPTSVDTISVQVNELYSWSELSENENQPESNIFSGNVDGIGFTTVQIYQVSGLNDQVYDTIVLTLENDDLPVTFNRLSFKETGADTGIFKPLPTLAFKFDGDLSTVDHVSVGQLTVVGTYAYTDIPKTASGHFSGYVGGLGDMYVDFPSFVFDPDTQETVTCTLTSDGLPVSQLPVTVLETAKNSLELRTPEDVVEPFDILHMNSIPGGPFAEMEVVPDSIVNQEGTFAGWKDVYFIEVLDPASTASTASYDGVSYDLLPVAGEPGLRRTGVPILLVGKPTYATSTSASIPMVQTNFRNVYTVTNGSFGLLHYNPDKWLKRFVEGKGAFFYSGPYYIYADHTTFQPGDEFISYDLDTTVNSVRIVIYPKDRPESEAVVDISAFTTKGTHRIWDGRTTTGKDADGKDNNVNGQFKFIDPKKYDGTTGYQVYVCKRYVDGVEVKNGGCIFEVRSKQIWLYSPASDLISENFVYGVCEKLDKTTGDYSTTTTLPQADDDPMVAFSMATKTAFRDSYKKLTARGQLISIGHGGLAKPDIKALIVLGRGGYNDPNASVLLPGTIDYDPEQVFAGFGLENEDGTVTGGTGVPDAPVYGLPKTDLHGLYFELRHCWTANDGLTASVAGSLFAVLNSNQGIGNGSVVGFVGEYNQAIAYALMRVRLGTTGITNTFGQEPGAGGRAHDRANAWMHESSLISALFATANYLKYQYVNMELGSVDFGADLAANVNGVPSGTMVLQTGLFFLNQRFFVGKMFDPSHPSGTMFKSPGTTNKILEGCRADLDLMGVDVDIITTEYKLVGPGRVGLLP